VVIGGDQSSHAGGATLADLIAELEILQSRYTDKHPDIIRLKKQIAEMKLKEDSLGGPDMSSEAIRIPLELRTQIADAQREIKLNEIDTSGIKSQIATYRQRIENTPK
jgi:hypothetical protein